MKHLLFASAAMGVLLWANPALAQNTAQTGITDIVVTAQRRTENVQKTALSIEVFGADKLARQGVSQPDDLTKIGTGIQVGGGTTTQIFVRGVGDFGVVATANPAVVVSLNGVAIARPQAISGNFFDLDRVEMLKGPQGTLYGRNASGGALNLIAAKPKLGETSGYINGSFGNYNALQTEGALNLALSDKTALRAAFQVADREGYLSDGGDDDRHQSFRLNALSKPNEALTIRIGGGYTHLGGKGSGLAVIPAIAGQSAWTGSTSSAAAAAYYQAINANYAASGGASPPAAVFDSPDTFRLFQNVQSWNVDAQVDYDFGGATLTVIPAYRRTTAKYSIQPSFNYSPGSNGTNGDSANQYSLEARLGHSGDRLKWVVGLFGFKEEQSSDFAVTAGVIQRVRIMSDLQTKALAGFGEATLHATDRLRLIAGLRYTSDERSQNNFHKYAISPTVTGASPCVPPAAMPGTQCSLLPAGVNYDSAKTFKRATWKLGAEFDLAPQSMIFATVATGFKAGGFNQAVDQVNTSKSLAFNPETVTAYTLGSRNRFMGNRLQVNLEGFYWDYKDLQLTSLILDGSGNVSLATQNAGKARLFGFNADVVAKPTEGLTLHAGVEYVNSKYTSFSYIQAAQFTGPGTTGCAVGASSLPAGPLGPYVTVNCAGKPLVRAPQWTANIGLSQVFALGNGGHVNFDTDVAYASSRYTSTSFIANAKVAPYANWSATLTYNAPGDKWFVGGYLRNITNAKVYTGGGGDQSPFVTGYITSSIGAPRTYGLRAGVRF